jgi:hypothetical protein
VFPPAQQPWLVSIRDVSRFRASTDAWRLNTGWFRHV